MLDDPKIEEINFLTRGLVPGPQLSKTGRTILDQVSFVGAPTFAYEHAAMNDVRIGSFEGFRGNALPPAPGAAQARQLARLRLSSDCLDQREGRGGRRKAGCE
jgi:hypothetical protein